MKGAGCWLLQGQESCYGLKGLTGRVLGGLLVPDQWVASA